VLCAVLGVAALVLCFTRYQSGSPFFAKQAIKLPTFRFRPYDSLPTENGNGVDHNDIPKAAPEALVGWRYRLGILQNAVLLALVFVHTLILLTVGPQLLRIVFIGYWVWVFACLLKIGGNIGFEFAAISKDVVSSISVQHYLCSGGLSFDLSLSRRHSPATISQVTITKHTRIRNTRMAIQYRHPPDCISKCYTVHLQRNFADI
jgi:hypothetical protein